MTLLGQFLPEKKARAIRSPSTSPMAMYARKTHVFLLHVGKANPHSTFCDVQIKSRSINQLGFLKTLECRTRSISLGKKRFFPSWTKQVCPIHPFCELTLKINFFNQLGFLKTLECRTRLLCCHRGRVRGCVF